MMLNQRLARVSLSLEIVKSSSYFHSLGRLRGVVGVSGRAPADRAFVQLRAPCKLHPLAVSPAASSLFIAAF